MTKFRLHSIIMIGLVGLIAAAPLARKTGAQSGDVLTSQQVRELAANAKTPADHMKLSKHFSALAARYEADAADHEEMAKAYRTTPTPSETKRPGAPDTAAHCQRFAELARQAAKEARDLAAAHEHMAASTK
jgi:hypothetical protein